MILSRPEAASVFEFELVGVDKAMCNWFVRTVPVPERVTETAKQVERTSISTEWARV